MLMIDDINPSEQTKPREMMPNRNCLCIHLKDAIVYNKQRAPLYAERTNGKSKIVSNLLIWYEWLGIPVAKWIDWRSLYFQQYGIHVICDDLIDMKETPKYGSMDESVKDKSFLEIDYKRLSNGFVKALHDQKFDDLVKTSHTAIEHIEKSNGSNCMLKHFLESIRRSAALMSMYRKKVPDPLLWNKLYALEKMYIKMQINSLGYTNFVDKKAAPIHKMGCGIICQDVPHIPFPEGY